MANLVKGILQAELARRGITSDQLAAKLAKLGVRDTNCSLRSRLSPNALLLLCRDGQ
jgi:hypothetical protein